MGRGTFVTVLQTPKDLTDFHTPQPLEFGNAAKM
jgi:hypothetical protein